MNMGRKRLERLIAYLPLLFAAVGLPMALKLIPPNHLYGIRTAETLASQEVWYASNFAAGITAVISGLVAAIVKIRVVNSAHATPAQKRHIPVLLSVGVAILMVFAGLASA
jgi:uncharacterized membrane protein